MRAKFLGWLAGILAVALSIGAAIFGLRKREAAKADKVEGEAREADARSERERTEWKKTIKRVDRDLESGSQKTEAEVWESLAKKGRLKS